KVATAAIATRVFLKFIFAFSCGASCLTLVYGTVLLSAEIQHQAVTRHLQQLYEDHQQSDGNHHYVGLKTLVTKTNGQVAQTAATDNPRHRRVGHQRDGCHSYACDDARKCFRQQGTEDDLADVSAHGLGGFDDAAVDFPQGGFHQAGEEGSTASDQRRDGAGYTQRCADEHDGERDHDDQQDDKRYRAQHVHHKGQHRVSHRLFEQLAFAEQEQQYANGQADDDAEQQRHAHHHQGVPAGHTDFQPVYIAHQVFHESVHQRTTST